MVNSAEGPGELIQALGRERVLLGFPGAGGQRVDDVVHYRLTSRVVQPTTIGELDGAKSERLVQIAQALSDAGFPVALSENMDAWLKTHVAVVSPIANAIYFAGGSNYRLAHTRDGLVLMVRAVKEGLRVLQVLHVPITPAKYTALAWLPEPLLIAALQKGFATSQAELVLGRHANAARDEMLTLAKEFRVLGKQSGVPTPAIDALFCYLDPAYPPEPEGKSTIPMDWRSTVVITGSLALAGLLVAWLCVTCHPPARRDENAPGSKLDACVSAFCLARSRYSDGWKKQGPRTDFCCRSRRIPPGRRPSYAMAC